MPPVKPDKYIFEMPVYCGDRKTWRVLNLNTGTVYCLDYDTEQEALDSINHGTIGRAGQTVCRVRMKSLRHYLADPGNEFRGRVQCIMDAHALEDSIQNWQL